MSAHFEELGWRQTPMGVISLRRRFDPSVRADVYEIKLDDEYLMSSLFTVAERELARLALARTPGPGLDVIVGCLGLGYTAQEVLECKRIRTLTVIEYSDAVIDWHERGLLPDTVGLAADGRVALVCADFFAAATSVVGFDPERRCRTYDAILLDVDNGPEGFTRLANDRLYDARGLAAARAALSPGGVLAVWSSGPDRKFTQRLRDAGFATEEVATRARGARGGARHVIWIATRPADARKGAQPRR